MARAKIAATIGPASADPEVVAEMIRGGVDAVRINASHAEPETIADWVARIRKGSRKAKRDVAVLLDLQGVKRRIGDLAEPRTLEVGDKVTFSSARGGKDTIPVKLKPLLPHLRRGTDVFLDDGFLRLEVVSKREREVVCKVVRGGVLRSRAGINLPGVRVPARIPTKQDLEHIRVGVAAGVDIFALSFVRTAKELWRCRKHTAGIPIIAKIELPEAVDAIEEIAAASDGVMVARGDLAVEMKPEQLPVLQKILVAHANRARKPVMVATEMLASMVHAPRPTRAELTDVGNAVLDGADATLLSDETAVGVAPARAVRYMARIIATVEGSLQAYDIDVPRPPGGEAANRPDWAVADAAVDTAVRVRARAILAVTGSGRTARLISANRPSVPVFTFSPDPAVCRRAALMWGVVAEVVKPMRNIERLIEHLLQRLRKRGDLARGDLVVVAFGSPVWAEGTKTNSVRVAVA